MKLTKRPFGKILFLSMPLKENYSYFHFTRKEKAGTLALLFIIGSLIAIPFLYSMVKPGKTFDDKIFANDIALLKLKNADSSAQKNYSNPYTENNDDYRMTNYGGTGNPKGERFNFDPNTLSEAGWIKMGIKPKTAATIQKYISKGGKFKSAEDLKKVWGLSPALVNELMPYVVIKEQPKKLFEPYDNYSNKPAYEKKEYPKKVIEAVDINTSGAEAWIALPGIGEKLAVRILTFKEKLGGFYEVAQIKELYGLPDSTYQKILPYLNLEKADVKKININTATLEELKAHPYIRYALANAIVEYRRQHGPYESVAKLKNIMIITDEILMKMAPYLAVN